MRMIWQRRQGSERGNISFLHMGERRGLRVLEFERKRSRITVDSVKIDHRKNWK